METGLTERKPPLTTGRVIRLVFFAFILVAVPVLTIIFGQMTRMQIKADVACSSPAIPDPKDCVGGEWIIAKNDQGCIHFVCKLSSGY